ncbi:MAG TPA: hypothetical protein DIW77_16375 [Chromatiaceae bacterium]|jgi:hypothetical protein|nr:MAG: hypothetical protein N838_26080 [Thiohalocapsa sp. PB-PSB1]HCS91569.1 hypothetical protein [Chromatiaceae bacterium]
MSMPAIQEQFPTTQVHSIESSPSTHDGSDHEQGWGLQRQQIAQHLLRDVETQRLPEALAIRKQVFSGEPITTAESDILAQMVKTVDQAAALMDDEQDLGNVRRGVAKLRDEILARASLN